MAVLAGRLVFHIHRIVGFKESAIRMTTSWRKTDLHLIKSFTALNYTWTWNKQTMQLLFWTWTSNSSWSRIWISFEVLNSHLIPQNLFISLTRNSKFMLKTTAQHEFRDWKPQTSSHISSALPVQCNLRTLWAIKYKQILRSEHSINVYATIPQIGTI